MSLDRKENGKAHGVDMEEGREIKRGTEGDGGEADGGIERYR